MDQARASHEGAVERLEALLRESKKSASQQVVEMSQQLKVKYICAVLFIRIVVPKILQLLSFYRHPWIVVDFTFFKLRASFLLYFSVQ